MVVVSVNFRRQFRSRLRASQPTRQYRKQNGDPSQAAALLQNVFCHPVEFHLLHSLCAIRAASRVLFHRAVRIHAEAQIARVANRLWHRRNLVTRHAFRIVHCHLGAVVDAEHVSCLVTTCQVRRDQLRSRRAWRPCIRVSTQRLQENPFVGNRSAYINCAC